MIRQAGKPAATGVVSRCAPAGEQPREDANGRMSWTAAAERSGDTALEEFMLESMGCSELECGGNKRPLVAPASGVRAVCRRFLFRRIEGRTRKWAHHPKRCSSTRTPNAVATLGPAIHTPESSILSEVRHDPAECLPDTKGAWRFASRCSPECLVAAASRPRGFAVHPGTSQRVAQGTS